MYEARDMESKRWWTAVQAIGTDKSMQSFMEETTIQSL